MSDQALVFEVSCCTLTMQPRIQRRKRLKTIDFLHERDVQLISHPPYSPDLAPCDIFLFLAWNDVFNNVPKKMFHDCFDDWFSRIRKCIEAQGANFKKL